MSRQTDILDLVLVRLGEIIPLGATLRGFRSSEKIDEAELPFAEAYAPVTTGEEETFQSANDSLTFILDLWGKKGTSETLRDAIEALRVELVRNSNLNGLCRYANMEDRAVGERDDDQLSVASVVLTVDFFPSEIIAGDVDLITLEGNESFVTFPDGEGGASADIPGAISSRKTNATVVTTAQQYSSLNSFPGLPIDLSAVPFLRIAAYIPDEIRSTFVSFELQLFSLPFNGNVYLFKNWRVGWNEFLVDVANPSSTVGGAIDLTAVVTFQSVFTFGAVETVMAFEQLIVDRFYHTRRDLGSDVAPGV